MTTTKNQGADSREEAPAPADVTYELEEALWRAGPMALAIKTPRVHVPRRLERPEQAKTEGGWWLAVADQGRPYRNRRLDVHLGLALEASKRESPNLAFTQDGEPVLVYRGHLRYRRETYIAPGLFFRLGEHLPLRVEDTLVHFFIGDIWFGAAQRPSTVSARAVEHWLGGAFKWLPELRREVLGDLYDPAKEVLDRFGCLTNRPYRRVGKPCNA